MSILEATYDNIDKVKFKNYLLEQNNLGIGYDILRHNTTEYTRKYDLESKYLVAVNINLKLAIKNNVTIISYYRLWK